MEIINKLLLLLLPYIVLGQHCPKFQSVVPLRPTATASNFSYAVIAGGKYYLFAGQGDQDLLLSGNMPEGFEDSRLTTVIDRLDCKDPEYYLITIKSIRMADNTVHTYFSNLDLINWNPLTQWTEPKPIKEHPMTANDPYIKLFTRFYPNYLIEDYIQTLFYWDVTKTIFVVTKPMVKPNIEHRYYSIETENACHRTYFFPESSESLGSALNSVLDPLDFCFFAHQKNASHSLLYCVSGDLFQVNLIKQQFENGTLRTETIGPAEKMPPTYRLKIFGEICNELNDPEFMAEQNIYRYQLVRNTNMGKDKSGLKLKVPTNEQPLVEPAENQVRVDRREPDQFEGPELEIPHDMKIKLHADRVLMARRTLDIRNLTVRLN